MFKSILNAINQLVFGQIIEPKKAEYTAKLDKEIATTDSEWVKTRDGIYKTLIAGLNVEQLGQVIDLAQEAIAKHKAK